MVFDHPPGLAALWLESPGKTPWPAAAAKPITPPQRVIVNGDAESFHPPAAAGMLIVRGAAPAIVALTQGDVRRLEAFPEGVELRAHIAPGEARLDVFPPSDVGLGGSLDIAIAPAVLAHEGLNDPVTLAAGEAALFAFEVKSDGEIGLGLRAEPDRATMRLFTAGGATLGEGAAQLQKLKSGRYFVEARAPRDAPLSVVRLAILGLDPAPAGPPNEIVSDILEKAGLKKARR